MLSQYPRAYLDIEASVLEQVLGTLNHAHAYQPVYVAGIDLHEAVIGTEHVSFCIAVHVHGTRPQAAFRNADSLQQHGVH
nr:hypothetical protein [Tanacetum cinerariifolium]